MYEAKYLINATIVSLGTGKLETGYTLLHDILEIHQVLNRE